MTMLQKKGISKMIETLIIIELVLIGIYLINQQRGIDETI